MRVLQWIEDTERRAPDHLRSMEHIEELLTKQAEAMPVGMDRQLTTLGIERAVYKLHIISGLIGGAGVMIEREARPLHRRLEGAHDANLEIRARLTEAEECIERARQQAGTRKQAASEIRLANVNLHLAASALRRLHQESGL